jgi:hypothetical protein
LKTDKKTGDKYLFIGKKKYWIKSQTPKAKIVSFVKDRFKKLGYAPKKYVVAKRDTRLSSTNSKKMTRIRQGKTPRPPRPPRESLEAKMEQIQQSRASPAEYELYRLSKDALLNIAKQAGIIGYRGMRKDQLIASIASIPLEKNIDKAIEDEIEKKDMKEQEREARKPVRVEPSDPLSALTKWELNAIAKGLNIDKPHKIRDTDLIKLIKDIQSGRTTIKEPPSDIDIKDPINNEPSTRRRSTIPKTFTKPSTDTSDSDDYNRSVARQARRNRERITTEMTPILERKETDPDEKKETPILTPEQLEELDKERKILEERRRIRGDTVAQTPSDFDWEGSSGEGKKKMLSGKGISNFDIDDMLKPFPEYLGCVSSDELITRILPNIQPQSRGFWINNLSPSTSGGSHWVGFFVDARPEGSNSIEYSDSFGDPVPDSMRQDLQEIADKLDAQKYLKLKENTLVQRQDDDTPNCGFFAVKFVLDRMRGKSFAEATGFDSSMKDESVDGEKEISKFKTQMGWGYLPSFLRRPNSMVDQLRSAVGEIKSAIFFPAKELSVPFKKFMAKYGDYTITKAWIRRQPISWAIDKLLNVISFGTWSQGKKELNYPDLFHLGIMLELRKGSDTKNVVLEKLERPHFTESWKDDANVEYVPVILKQPSGKRAFPSLNDFVQRTIDKIGIHNFVVYGGFRGINCQNFIMDLLDANSSLTPQAKAFIYQPIEELVKKMPSWVDKISQGVTDFSARARQFFGIGKNKHKPNPRLDALLKNFQK